MRSYVLLLALVVALGMALRFPYAGVIVWTWFSLQNPQMESWGIINSIPTNLIIVLVTVIALAVSKERKLPPSGPIVWALIAFMVWMTFNSFFAFDPKWSWPYWDRTWKIFALGFVVAATATNRTRIHALLWTCVISLFFYGVKGGIFTIMTGGHSHVFGPPNTIIGDNNQLAVALLMTLPLANYLRLQTADRRIGMLLLACIVLTVIAVLGTYSRGALIGLAALAALFLIRSKNKFLYLAMAAVVLAFALNFMPDEFFNRMDTISQAQNDASFHGRLIAWQVAYRYAVDHFPLGAGFYGPQLPGIFNHYYPGEINHAAHSIYFQVLGENGFPGLAIYLFMIAAAFITGSRVIAAARQNPQLQWVADLGVALQASLFVFCVAGAGLSMAYYDLFVIVVLLLLPLQKVVLEKKEEASAAVAALAPG
ncbi:MAG: putative O-glycosylation ligase, exosortase A system-associated [Alphaproteobacteria bacterium]|nr:putative O-glycosylation ligase, exosortase A system-associated [Alphaproteobacteria bacterium]